jgi:hypothetical protein
LLPRLQVKGRPKVADNREGKQEAEGKDSRAGKLGSRTKTEVVEQQEEQQIAKWQYDDELCQGEGSWQ